MRKRRYVSGKRDGLKLQTIYGRSAAIVLEDRRFGRSPAWFARNYPIIYELVPISEKELEKRAAEE